MAESNFHRLLRAKLLEVKEKRAYSLSQGNCVDYPAYRQEVGAIMTIDDVLALCEEIERENNL